MKGNKTGIIILILIIIAAGLFLIQRVVTPGAGAYWEDTNIACLTLGHQNLGQHFHPTLKIVVDDTEETIPANVGIRGNCMAEAHTHDATGAIHFESVAPNKQFTLADFFAVWGRDIEQKGYILRATLNGEEVTTEELYSQSLADHDNILLTYTSNTNETMNDTTLTLTSSAFAPNGSIPAQYTCDGQNITPPLTITGVPQEAKSLTLIVDDPDIPQEVKASRGIEVFDHWVVFNIAPHSLSVHEGEQLRGTLGQNSAGATAYTGPCPPAQYEPTEHRYRFKLYALDIELNLAEGATREAVEQAITGHIMEQTELVGRYERG